MAPIAFCVVAAVEVSIFYKIKTTKDITSPYEKSQYAFLSGYKNIKTMGENIPIELASTIS